MSSLDGIVVEGAALENRALVDSLLVEVATRLEDYLDRGERGEIDLRTLPLTPQDHQALLSALGRGEVTISLAVMGESEIIETAYAGVWHITHRDEEQRVIAETIEICLVPGIVGATAGEMRDALQRLRQGFRLTTECSSSNT